MDKFKKSNLELYTHYEDILLNAGICVFWKDLEGRIIDYKGSGEKFRGKSIDETIGHTAEELGAVNTKFPPIISDQEIISTGKKKTVLGRILNEVGAVRDVIMTKMPFIVEGETVGVIVIIDDITDMDHSYTMTSDLERTFYNLPVGICVYEVRDNGYHLIQTNPVALRMLNLRVEDIEEANLLHMESAIRDCLHPDDRWQIAYGLSKMKRGIMDITCSCRFYPKGSDNYIWLQCKIKGIPQTDGSYLVYMTLTDITTEKRSEEALVAAQRAYHEVAAGAGLIVWRYDIQKGIMEFLDNKVTSHIPKVYELPQKLENAPESFEKNLAPESIADFRRLHRLVREGKSASCDVRFRQIPGKPPHWERFIYSMPKNATEGGPNFAYGVGMDVTSEKLRQQQYNKELQLLHTPSNTNLLAKCHFDLTDNKLLDYLIHSPNAMRLEIGMTYTGFLELLCQAITSPQEKSTIGMEISQETLMHRYVTGDKDMRFEYKRQCDDMSPIMVEANLSLFTGKTGHVECFIYTYDVTNKFINYVIADKISDLGYSYVAIVNNFTGTMTFYSKKTGVVENTPEHPLFYDEKLYSFLGRHFTDKDTIEELYSKLSLDYITDQLENVPLYDYSYDCPRKDGTYARRRIQACYLDKTHTSVFIIQSDATQQYQLERKHLDDLERAIMEADKANESKSIFLSGISHDMRTPLNGILSFTNFALQTSDENKRTAYLHKIRHSGELLMSLINDTLNLTRIESGKVTVNREWVYTLDMLDEILSGINMAAEERNITLINKREPGMPTKIITDKLKVQEILLNLLSNSVKFTKPGGWIEFGISLVHDEEQTEAERAQVRSPQDKWFRLVIADNGIGMGKEFLPRLYDAFAQEESTEIENPNGTGLGLCIVKKYVDMLGGTISVQSELGKGTTFELHLMAEESLEDQNEWHTDNHGFDFHGIHVLLVEDNPLNQEIANMLLQNNGATLDIANNGEECIQLFESAPAGTYQLILMDIRMPVMNGYQATDHIRSSDKPGAATIPIIAMTADAYEEDVRKCLAHGMNSHVSKPINPEQLYREISKHCLK